MRLRKIQGAEEILQAHPQVIQEPKGYRGKWNKAFEGAGPIHIELGMGRGAFITGMAIQNPYIQYIGFEKHESLLIKAIKKLEEQSIPNVRLVCMNVEEIEEVFGKKEIDRIYLNFSDPWPKKRHNRRRLTYREFLRKYAHILEFKGEVHLKTDNKNLFDFSLEEFEEERWEIKHITRDLHHSPYISNNVMTEYERRFVKQGKPIYRCEAIAPESI